jgi:transposase-like protein
MEAINACRQPGVSIAAAAMARSINANLLRRWITEAEGEGDAIGQRTQGLHRRRPMHLLRCQRRSGRSQVHISRSKFVEGH